MVLVCPQAKTDKTPAGNYAMPVWLRDMKARWIIASEVQKQTTLLGGANSMTMKINTAHYADYVCPVAN